MLLPWCKVGDIPTPWPGLAWPVSCATPLIRGCPHFRPYIFGGFENMGEREIKREVWSERGMAHTFLPLAFLTKGEKYPLWYSEPVPHSLSLSFSPFFLRQPMEGGKKKAGNKRKPTNMDQPSSFCYKDSSSSLSSKDRFQRRIASAVALAH